MTRALAHLSPLLRSLEDSVNWAAIPVDEPMVAGYVSPSHFAWPAAAWARFPHAIKIRITPSATVYGLGIQVIDVETGDATPDQVPGWSVNSRRRGQEPTAYMAYAKWAEVIRACTSARVTVPQFWVALWNDQNNLPTITVDGVAYTAAAHQLADPGTSGGDYDRSAVAGFWLGVDTGADMSFDLSTVLPDPASVAGSNTVAEGLTANLYGIGSHRNGGSLSNAIASLQASTAGALTALVAAVATADSDVKAAATQEAADHAANLMAVSKLGVLDPSVLEADLRSVLTALGWTAPPTADQNAAATAPAVLALIQARLAGGST